MMLGLMVVVGLGACQAPPVGPRAEQNDRERAPQAERVSRMIDGWHRAASEGNARGYFGRMTDEAVFIGTDASERWVGEAFRDWAMPYFDGVEAWTYEPTQRHVYVGRGGGAAWWDELLENDRYGTARGVGIAVLQDDGLWRIAHYTLHFPVPNGVAGEVTDLIGRHRRGGTP